MIKVVKIEMDDDPVSRELQIAAASPALVYNEPVGSDEHYRKEVAIKREKWSCYGSTEVCLLVLEEETKGTEHITAVLPINEGLSLRKIGTNDENFLTIGVCRNVFVCRGTPVESSFDDDKMQRDRVRGQNQSTLTGLQDLHYDSSSTAAFKPPSREEVKKYLTKMYNFSLLTGEHLKYNVDWLAETFQDEFPSRCWSAGSKIVAEMPKTALGTAMFMRKVYDRWAKDDRKNWR
ncbi:hypothetical protein MPSEU_000978300 [Mayamaea pseudoterrestris]|nr:hypothetical protein MPSEU_000978300 [Mayamaea pseudoterrestris]